LERRRLFLWKLLFVLVLSFYSILPASVCASDSGSKLAPPAAGAASAADSREPSSEHIRQLLHDGAWSDAEAEARRLLTVK
jgi:hypothetical protein